MTRLADALEEANFARSAGHLAEMLETRLPHYVERLEEAVRMRDWRS